MKTIKNFLVLILITLSISCGNAEAEKLRVELATAKLLVLEIGGSKAGILVEYSYALKAYRKEKGEIRKSYRQRGQSIDMWTPDWKQELWDSIVRSRKLETKKNSFFGKYGILEYNKLNLEVQELLRKSDYDF